LILTLNLKTKNWWHFDVKVHAMSWFRKPRIPFEFKIVNRITCKALTVMAKIFYLYLCVKVFNNC